MVDVFSCPLYLPNYCACERLNIDNHNQVDSKTSISLFLFTKSILKEDLLGPLENEYALELQITFRQYQEENAIMGVRT